MPVVIVVAILICSYIYVAIKKVLEHSIVLKELSRINSITNYKIIEPTLFKRYTCVSRAEYNRFSLENYFLEIIRDNENQVEKKIGSIEFNKRAFGKYNKEISEIDWSASKNQAQELKIPFFLYKQIEQYFFHKKQIAPPVTDVCIICRKEYTTPAGKTHVWSDAEFHYGDVKQYLRQAKEMAKQRELRTYHVERERALMSNSLRYDILKRDGFRCQICGSTAQDGVKLHVDHIIPVSKGGHTVPGNLRTLCDRCNSGKSDKIESITP